MLRIALPLIISTASWTVMNFIDRMFLAWYSIDSMAAALPAGLFHFSLVCFPLGVTAYVNTFVAQYYGAGRPQRIGPSVWQGVWLGLIAAPFFLAMIPFAPLFFSGLGHTPKLAALEATYFQMVALGAGAEIIAGSLSSFFTGRGSMKTVMIVDSLAALLNCGLDYIWIFGGLGFGPHGIKGAALATAVALWFRVFAYAAIMTRKRYREKFNLWSGRRWDASLFKRLLRYGGPSGAQMFVEMGAFSLFLLFVGRLGETATAATTLAFNVNLLAFMPMIGLGLALSTVVGHQLGAERPALAARAIRTCFVIASVYMGTMALGYVLFPGLFTAGHRRFSDPTEFARIYDLTVVLLRFVAAYCLFDSMNVIFVSALKGAGDTRFILVNSLVMTPILVVLVGGGVVFFGLGIIWAWSVVTVWISALGLIYAARFLQGHWKTMRVIEPHIVEEDV